MIFYNKQQRFIQIHIKSWCLNIREYPKLSYNEACLFNIVKVDIENAHLPNSLQSWKGEEKF